MKMTTSCVAVDASLHVDVCDECLVVQRVIFGGFHPIDHCGCQDTYVFKLNKKLKIINRNYLPRVRQVTKTSVRYRKNIQSGERTCKDVAIRSG